MKKLKTFAFCTLLAALAANHTPATAANGPTGDAAPATRDSEPKMYAWEQERDAIPSYTDLVLCYGGSHHRTPYRWDKERFTPFVTYVDEEGSTGSSTGSSSSNSRTAAAPTGVNTPTW